MIGTIRPRMAEQARQQFGFGHQRMMKPATFARATRLDQRRDDETEATKCRVLIGIHGRPDEAPGHAKHMIPRDFGMAVRRMVVPQLFEAPLLGRCDRERGQQTGERIRHASGGSRVDAVEKQTFMSG